MKIHQILSDISITFTPENRLSDVLTALADNHHSCALVCVEDRLTGILTERDVVRLYAEYTRQGEILNPLLSEIMSANPVCIAPDTDISEALSLARNHNLRHLPVVDDRRVLLGIVTLTNLMASWLTLHQEYHKLEKVNATLKWQSLEDPLTGLLNRRAMELDLKHAETVSKRRDESYAVALMDVDYFKRYNDHYGHDAGDEALRHVARVLKNNIRGSDKAYRYGGEEFLYLMPDTDVNGALNVCERIRFALFHSRIEHVHSPHHFLSMSMGIAACTGGNWETLLSQADTALYQAKQIGRNTICTAIVSGHSTLAISDKRLAESQVH